MIKRFLSLLLVLISPSIAYAEAVPGGVYTWPLPTGADSITFNGKPVMIHRGHALVGLPITTEPGTATLAYELDGNPGQHNFEVVAKAYTEQHIQIENPAMVNPPAETLERIRTELSLQRSLYAQFNEPVIFNAFRQPLEGRVSSLYGHRRYFNGQPRSPHSGLDLAAPAGTPISAAAPGVVTLARDLYFNGYTVFLDHGQGLITMYCHMQEILVSEGDTVGPDETIGLVGTTGRSTGPHLHWSVSLNGNRVDPQTFMAVFNEIQ